MLHVDDAFFERKQTMNAIGFNYVPAVAVAGLGREGQATDPGWAPSDGSSSGGGGDGTDWGAAIPGFISTGTQSIATIIGAARGVPTAPGVYDASAKPSVWPTVIMIGATIGVIALVMKLAKG